MFRVVEVGLHIHRLSNSTSGISQWQAEHYGNHPHYSCPEGCHLPSVSPFIGAIKFEAERQSGSVCRLTPPSEGASQSANHRLTAKRMFHCKSFQRNEFFWHVRQLSVSVRVAAGYCSKQKQKAAIVPEAWLYSMKKGR